MFLLVTGTILFPLVEKDLKPRNDVRRIWTMYDNIVVSFQFYFHLKKKKVWNRQRDRRAFLNNEKWVFYFYLLCDEPAMNLKIINHIYLTEFKSLSEFKSFTKFLTRNRSQFLCERISKSKTESRTAQAMFFV